MNLPDFGAPTVLGENLTILAHLPNSPPPTPDFGTLLHDSGLNSPRFGFKSPNFGVPRYFGADFGHFGGESLEVLGRIFNILGFSSNLG